MSTIQQVYRELRQHMNKDEARYAAPRLLDLHSKWERK